MTGPGTTPDGRERLNELPRLVFPLSFFDGWLLGFACGVFAVIVIEAVILWTGAT